MCDRLQAPSLSHLCIQTKSVYLTGIAYTGGTVKGNSCPCCEPCLLAYPSQACIVILLACAWHQEGLHSKDCSVQTHNVACAQQSIPELKLPGACTDIRHTCARIHLSLKMYPRSFSTDRSFLYVSVDPAHVRSVRMVLTARIFSPICSHMSPSRAGD